MILEQNNAQAFEEWVKKHETYAYRFAYSILMHRQDAQDAVCEAFFKVYKTKNIAELENPKSYLLTTVHHCCCDILRKRKKLVLTNNFEGLDSGKAFDDFNGFEQKADIEKMLNSLPHDMRTAIVLKHYYGWGYDEIAKLLNIPNGTVSSRINRGKKHLIANMKGERYE